MRRIIIFAFLSVVLLNNTIGQEIIGAWRLECVYFNDLNSQPISIVNKREKINLTLNQYDTFIKIHYCNNPYDDFSELPEVIISGQYGYKKPRYNRIKSKGTYNYDPDEGVLLLFRNDKIHEYKVSISNDIMILQFQDNEDISVIVYQKFQRIK